MLVCWNAALVSGRLAEFEQVLCKLPVQPCMSVTLSPRAGGARLICVPALRALHGTGQGRLGEVKAKREQALILPGDTVKGHVE